MVAGSGRGSGLGDVKVTDIARVRPVTQLIGNNFNFSIPKNCTATHGEDVPKSIPIAGAFAISLNELRKPKFY